MAVTYQDYENEGMVKEDRQGEPKPMHVKTVTIEFKCRECGAPNRMEMGQDGGYSHEPRNLDEAATRAESRPPRQPPEEEKGRLRKPKP